jgi:hypothetical protein
MTEGIARKPGGPAAKWGISAHHVSELCLTNERTPEHYLSKIIEEVEVTREMVKVVDEYLDYIYSTMSTIKGGCQLFVEVGVMAYDGIDTRVLGTVDCALIGKHTIYVIDLKTGKGVSVDADSSQLLIYAVGLMNGLQPSVQARIKTIHTVIVQPRDRGGDILKIHTMKPKHLRSWAKKTLVPGIHAALDPLSKCVPGEDQCRWCDAASRCNTLAKHNQATASQEFSSMTTSELVEAYEQFPLINIWMKAITEDLHDKLMKQSVEGLKLVHGRSSRKWNGDDEIIEHLLKICEVPAHTQKLTSAPQAMGQVSRDQSDILIPWISKEPGNLIMVTESDPRPSADPGDDFK